jgi:hypothetical protein
VRPAAAALPNANGLAVAEYIQRLHFNLTRSSERDTPPRLTEQTVNFTFYNSLRLAFRSGDTLAAFNYPRYVKWH